MKLKIGSPVSGDNFYPRSGVVNQLQKALSRDNVSFLAPRRTGKTSILIHLEDCADDSHPHFRINLETCTTPAEMISALIRPLHELNPRWKKVLGKASGGIAKGLKKIESVKIGPLGLSIAQGQDAWQRPAELFLDQLLSYGGPITFLLDEFPILVNAAAQSDRDGCEAMLRWFREWRQRTVDSEIRFLVTGSIGLESVVRKYGFADTVNDFDEVDLPPLSREEGIEFIQQLADGTGLPLDMECIEKMLGHIGNAWPYFLQIYLAELDDARTADSVIDSAFLDRIYLEKVVGGSRNKYLPHMWTRLDKAFSSEEAKMARAILHGVAKSSTGLNNDQLEEAAYAALPQSTPLNETTFSFVLNALKHDGYLFQEIQEPFRTGFFSNLLHDYWVKHHG